MMETYNDWLMHFGRKGQKWGVMNGPPYPLSSSQMSAKERKENKKKARQYTKDLNKNARLMTYNGDMYDHYSKAIKDHEEAFLKSDKVKTYESAKHPDGRPITIAKKEDEDAFLEAIKPLKEKQEKHLHEYTKAQYFIESILSEAKDLPIDVYAEQKGINLLTGKRWTTIAGKEQLIALAESHGVAPSQHYVFFDQYHTKYKAKPKR